MAPIAAKSAKGKRHIGLTGSGRQPAEAQASPEADLSVKAAFLLALFTFAAMVFTTFLDISRFPIAGSDEIGYLDAGLNDLSNQWNIYSFPIHSMVYALTGLFEADPIRNYKLNAFVPFFLMTLLLQLHVLRWTGSVLLAVLATLPLLLSPDIGVTAWPHANQTVCIVFLVGLLLVPRHATLSVVAMCFVTVYFLMAFTRSEQMLALYLALALVGLGVGLALIKMRSLSGWLRVFLAPLGLAVALIVALSALMGSPVLLDKYRSLSAFSQHYAYGLSLRAELEEHPWTEHRVVFERAFGDTTSISGAMRANPMEFTAHVLSNVSQFFQWALKSDPIGGIGWLLALALFLGALVLFIRRLLHGWRSGAFNDLDAGRLICIAAPAPCIVLILLIFPRANYLQMGYVMLLAAAVFLLRRDDIPALARNGAASALAMLSAVSILALITPVAQKTDPHETVLRLLNRDLLSRGMEEVFIARTAGVCPLLTLPCTETRIQHSQTDLDASLQDVNLDYIVLVRHPDSRFRQEDLAPYLEQRFADGSLPNWQALEVPDGWHLLRRSAP